jgi:DNA-binding transcriptional ArsR family regulator
VPDEDLARAIRPRVRRKILKILCKRKRASVHEIAKELEISESSASKHLKLLYDLGILNYEEKPPEKYYFINVEYIDELLSVYEKVVQQLSK